MQQFSEPLWFTVSCWVTSLLFLQGLTGSSSICVVPTPFIVLFRLETIQGFINSYLAMSVLIPKGVLPVAILKNRYEKALVITSSSFT